MKRNPLRRLTTVIALAIGLGTGAVSSIAAQIWTKPVIPFPVQLPAADTVVEITAGDQHTCVRKYDGTVYCWGDDLLGQLGPVTTKMCKGMTTTDPCTDTPSQVATLSSIGSQIVAGASHTCAVNA